MSKIKVRRSGNDYEYQHRRHVWEDNGARLPSPIVPTVSEPVCVCALCGAEAVPSQMGTPGGPGLCNPHWSPITGLAPFLQASIRKQDASDEDARLWEMVN